MEPQSKHSVYSDGSFGSRSMISTRSVTGALAKKTYNPRTQTIIEESANKSVEEVEQQSENRKKKSPIKKKPKQVKAKGNALTRKRAREMEAQTNLSSTPSSSQQNGGKFPRLNFHEANWGIRQSCSDASPTIYLSEYTDGQEPGDEPSNSTSQTNDNISVETSKGYWWDTSKMPTVSDRVHKSRRIVIDGKIFQYYQDIPAAVSEIAWKDSNKSVSDARKSKPNKFADMNATIPKSGVTHIYYVENFKIPDSAPEGAVYLGHLLTVGAKPQPHQKSLHKKVDKEQYGVCDWYIWFCEKCCDNEKCVQTTYKSRGKSGSFQLNKHYSGVHNSVLEAKKKQKIVFLKKENGEYVPADVNKFDASSETNATAIAYILKMIVDNNLAMSVVDSWSLREAFLFLQPRLRIPGRSTMTSLLNSTVDIQLRPILQAEFDSAKYMCMIADAWSNRRRQGILAVRICYFGPDLQWKVKTISVRRIIGRHTKVNLADMIYDDMVQWNLIGKIKHITTDAGANIKAAMKEVKDLGPYTLSESVHDEADSAVNVIELNKFVSSAQPPVAETHPGSSTSVESTLMPPPQSPYQPTLSEILEDHNDESPEHDPEEPPITDLLDLENDERFVHTTYSLAEDDKFPSEDSCTWTHCSAHNTQIILSNVEKDNAAIHEIKERNNSVGRFCRREQVAAHIKNQSGVMFQRAGKTRWSSNITAAVRLWNPTVKEAINFMIAEESRLKKSDPNIPEPYSDEEYEKLHEYILLLRPLQVLTDRLQGDGIVSPFVIPHILECYLDISAIQGLKYMNDAKKTILLDLETRHGTYLQDPDFILATFLNPVCRLEFFKKFDCGYAEVTPICLNGTTTDKLKIWLHNLPLPPSGRVESYAKKFLVSNGEKRRALTGDINRSVEVSNLSAGKINTGGNRLIQEMLCQQSSGSLSNATKTDLDIYLEMYVHPSTDLIAFWTSKYEHLPYLSRFVEYYFIKMPSSGTVERLFSIIANIDLPDRCSSTAKTLQSRMVYKENMNIIAKVKVPKMTDSEEKSLESKVLESIKKIRNQKIL